MIDGCDHQRAVIGFLAQRRLRESDIRCDSAVGDNRSFGKTCRPGCIHLVDIVILGDLSAGGLPWGGVEPGVVGGPAPGGFGVKSDVVDDLLQIVKYRVGLANVIASSKSSKMAGTQARFV